MSKDKNFYDKSQKKLVPNSNQAVLFDYKGKNGETQAIGIFSHITPRGDAYIKYEGKPFWRKPEKIQIINNNDDTEEGTEETPSSSVQVVNVNEVFNINQRFEFMAALVRMVLSEQLVSLLITGEGGIGKTYTVLQQIEDKGFVKPDHYWMVKGYSTAKGLYNTLYEHNGKLIVFDDCDEVLTNDVARNILKGALDSYDERIISWVKEGGNIGDTPPEFEFTGRVIFISNLKKNRVPQAILSRAANIDLSMSIDDKMDRMRNILPYICKDVDMEVKKEALELIEKHKFSCKDLNFRTLSKAITIMNSNEKDVDGLTEFMILS